METSKEPKILNLSNYPLTEDEKSLLNYGLKFCPTPNSFNIEERKIDVKNFCRRLRLAEFFKGRETTNISVVRPSSIWEPDYNDQSTELNSVINLIKSHPLTDNTKNKIHNINKSERNAIKNLKENRDIVIKEADKGSSIVIMNRNFYESKILEMLNDTETYREIPTNMDKSVIKKIKNLAQKHNSYLTRDERKYISNFEYKTSVIYGLPKVHKSKIIQQAIKTQKSEYINALNASDLKLRPILAGPQSPTHRLSHLIDILLQPFLKYVQSYTKDTVHFLNKLPSTVNDEETLLTFDVVSLYTNISHELGLKALRFWLEKYPEETGRFSKEFILEATALILHNNYFDFNDQHYLQILGTAMGSKFSPCYANLVLGYLEIQLKQTIVEEFNEEIADEIMSKYTRYLDDIFLIWNKNRGDPNCFKEWLSSTDARLSFTLDQCGSSVSFLDVKVSIKELKISTDIFYKPTDTKKYLDYKSCHPRHIKNNIPFNLARRICTITSEAETTERRLQELKLYLKRCNYPINVINLGIEKALSIPKETLRSRKEHSTNEISKIPFVSTFTPNSNNLFQMAYNMTNILKENIKTRDIFKKFELINARRQPNNLKSILTSARHRITDKQYRVTKCRTSRCNLCDEIIEGSSFKFSNGKIFNVNSDMDCNTLNCIYVLKCMSCQLTYIGETSNFRLRVNLHRNNAERNVGLNVSRHIHQCTSALNLKFKIMPFYKVNRDDIRLRKSKEQYFIKTFQPELNRI